MTTAFIIGLVIGACFGVFVAGLLAAGKRADDVATMGDMLAALRGARDSMAAARVRAGLDDVIKAIARAEASGQ